MLIGLTGAPGCGKSAALDVFASLGFFAVDADRVCSRLYSDPAGPLPKLFAGRWGDAALSSDGLPSRAFIAEKAFNDESERSWLNSVVHPAIQKEALSLFEKSGAAHGVLEAALIFEASWTKLFSCVVAIWSEPAIQAARLAARGWSAEEARLRTASQLPAAGKLEMADFGLVNNSTLDALREQCEALSKTILNSKFK